MTSKNPHQLKGQTVKHHTQRMVAIIAVLATMLAACNGGDTSEDVGDVDDPTAAAEVQQDAEEQPDAEGPGEPVSLSFQTLAWQEQSVAANHAIIDAWNEQNPDIQVEYVQGDWGSVHDQLLTSFEGGAPPDILHYEATPLQVFAEGDYLADLSQTISPEFRASIPEELWATVEYEEQGTVGVPFLVESRLPLANRTMLEEAGVRIPTPEEPWTWDEFQEAAMQLTTEDTYGVAFPLGSPTNAVLTLSPAMGGTWIENPEEDPSFAVGEAEVEIPRRIHEMIYEDKSADPAAVSSSVTDSLPGFFAGEYAMVFAAIWLRQQMVEQAPEDFDWVTIPPLVGPEGSEQAVSPQILSVAAQSEHPAEATQFIEFFLNGENMAELALGDWLVPTSEEALDAVQSDTGGEQGWDVAVGSAESLTAMPWQRVSGVEEWMSRVATPSLQRYFADEISLEDLQSELGDSDVQLGS